MSALPLMGVRVIELCWVWSGPLLGQLLADLGAEVIKVEWYKRFDLYRTRGVERLAGKYPEHIRREMSQSFHGLNRNKIGVAMDLKRPEHRDALLELVKQSDLVIENFTSGTMERLGIGYDELAAANPKIVLLSLAAFGASSRLGEMRAYGLVLSAMSGLETNITDPRSKEFRGSPTFVISDPNAATYALLTAMAALQDATRVGGGSHVEMSQLEAAALLGANDDQELSSYADALGLPPGRFPPPASVVPTGERQHLLVDWQGHISVSDYERVRQRAATQSASDGLDEFRRIGARAIMVIDEPAKSGAGAAHDDTLLPTVHPITGPEYIVAAPWWIDGRRSQLRKTAPTLGEGNTYVFGKLLGWAPESYQSMEALPQGATNG